MNARQFRISGACGVFSAEEIAAATCRASCQLAAEKVDQGDVVLYQGLQGVEAFVLFWAAIMRGAIFVPLDQEWPEYLVERVVSMLKPRVVLSDLQRAGFYKRAFPNARHVSLENVSGTSGVDWKRWLAAADASSAGPVKIGEDAPAAYLFTSGSTGMPKAVVLSRRALARGGRLTVDCFGWDRGEVLVNAPEPHMMSGLRNAFVAAPFAGMQLHIVPAGTRPYVFELLATLRVSRCERLVVSPNVIRQLNRLGPRVSVDTFRCMKAIYCTGARLSASDVEDFYARFRIPIVNYYGLTESGGICVAQRLTAWRPDDHSLGTAAGAELRVVDEDGRWESVGEGELFVRSPQLMSGYLGDSERSAARLVRGWLRTGDRVRIEPDGRCFLVGRIDGFMKSASADRIAPEEIEAVLEEHGAVAEAGVLALVSERGDEQIVALVVLHAEKSVSTLDLAVFVRERLGPARMPARIQYAERLPRGKSGKLARAELRAMLRDPR